MSADVAVGGDGADPWRPPPAVRAWRARPLLLVVPVTLLFVLLVNADRGVRSEWDADRQGWKVVTAEVVRTEGATSAAQWSDETTGEQLQIALEHDARGPTVQLRLHPRDLAQSVPLDAPSPGGLEQMVVYLIWFLPPWGWFLARCRTVRRTRRLVAAEVPSFVMQGADVQPRGRARPTLHLYAVDAEAGDRPLCAVPMIELDRMDLGSPFQVEVKGSPRPGGRVVVSRDGVIRWPAGRALLVARAGRPSADRRPCLRNTVAWGALSAVGLVLLAFVPALLWEVSEARLERSARESGREVQAEVTHVVDDFEVYVRYPLPQDPQVTVHALVWPSGNEPMAGRETLRVLVPQDDPVRPFLVGDGGQGFWLSASIAVVGAVVVVVTLAVSAERHRRLRRQLLSEPMQLS